MVKYKRYEKEKHALFCRRKPVTVFIFRSADDMIIFLTLCRRLYYSKGALQSGGY